MGCGGAGLGYPQVCAHNPGITLRRLMCPHHTLDGSTNAAECMASAISASVVVALSNFGRTSSVLIAARCDVVTAVLTVMRDASAVSMDVKARKLHSSGFMLTGYFKSLRVLPSHLRQPPHLRALILLGITTFLSDHCLVVSDVALALFDIDVVMVNVVIFVCEFSDCHVE